MMYVQSEVGFWNTEERVSEAQQGHEMDSMVSRWALAWHYLSLFPCPVTGRASRMRDMQDGLG